MFKKKANIPPRPRPPVTEQLLDDLKNAPEGDIVFTLRKNTNANVTSVSSLEEHILPGTFSKIVGGGGDVICLHLAAREDQQHATKMCILLEAEKDATLVHTKSQHNTTTTSQIDSDDLNDPEIVFQKVRTFVEMNSNLQTIMNTLQVQNEELLCSVLEMKNLAEDIRRQALEALK